MAATIATGSNVKVLMNGKHKSFKIVEPHESDPISGHISWDSPVASALIGATVGSSVSASLPNGNVIGISVIEIA